MKVFTLIFVLILASISLVAAEKAPPNIKSLMTAEDYSASGLDKLSTAEREHLSGWVERYRDGAIKGPPPAPKKLSEMTEQEQAVAKKEREEKRNEQIVAKVLPSFRGWSGKTVFHLDNGQVWQQRIHGSMRYSGGDSTVIITTNVMGKYVMQHQDSGRSVGVKRIR